MSDTEISRRGLVLGGLALMLSGCTQATGAMSTQTTGAVSLGFPERPLPDPRFQRQRVQYDGGESPGTIVVSIEDRFLYAVEEDGWATRYGVAVGEQGLTFKGRATVGRKAGVAIVDTHRRHDAAASRACCSMQAGFPADRTIRLARARFISTRARATRCSGYTVQTSRG